MTLTFLPYEFKRVKSTKHYCWARTAKEDPNVEYYVWNMPETHKTDACWTHSLTHVIGMATFGTKELAKESLDNLLEAQGNVLEN